MKILKKVNIKKKKNLNVWVIFKVMKNFQFLLIFRNNANDLVTGSEKKKIFLGYLKIILNSSRLSKNV